MMDTFHVEYYTKEGTRIGVQISAYYAQDALRYVEKLPNFYQLALYPEKIEIGYKN